MSTYYQLVFLGNIGCEACQKVRKRFFEMLDERGLEASLVSVLDGTAVMTGEYQSSKPTFAFYFGGAGIGLTDVVPVQKLMGNADAVYV